MTGAWAFGPLAQIPEAIRPAPSTFIRTYHALLFVVSLQTLYSDIKNDLAAVNPTTLNRSLRTIQKHCFLLRAPLEV